MQIIIYNMAATSLLPPHYKYGLSSANYLSKSLALSMILLKVHTWGFGLETQVWKELETAIYKSYL